MDGRSEDDEDGDPVINCKFVESTIDFKDDDGTEISTCTVTLPSEIRSFFFLSSSSSGSLFASTLLFVSSTDLTTWSVI